MVVWSYQTKNYSIFTGFSLKNLGGGLVSHVVVVAAVVVALLLKTKKLLLAVIVDELELFH